MVRIASLAISLVLDSSTTLVATDLVNNSLPPTMVRPSSAVIFRRQTITSRSRILLWATNVVAMSHLLVAVTPLFPPKQDVQHYSRTTTDSVMPVPNL